MERPGLTAIVREALFDESATDVAVTTACPVVVRLAMNLTVEPVVESRDPGPLSFHVTPLSEFVTVAVTLNCAPASTA